jgi:MFS family permease
VFSALSGPHFLEWGWRIPFLLSGGLIGFGLYVRLGILETPVFAQLVKERRIEKAPVLEAIRRQPREIALTALCRMGEQAPFYISSAFVFAYGTGTLHLPRNFLLQALLTATAISVFMTPFAGHLSDRFGRKRIYMLGAAITGVYGFAYFAMLDSRVPSVVFVAIALSLVAHDIMYGPQAALIAESFGARVRYSGASLGYQLSSIFAGGPAPLIATWLLGRYHSGTSIAIFILLCALISLASTAMLRDYTGRDPAE